MRRIKSILAAALAVLVALTVIPAAFAYPGAPGVLPEDYAKLYNFWQQEAYDGMNNGEAVYDFEVPDYANPLFGHSYAGSWYTDLVDQDLYGHWNGFYFRLMFEFYYSFEDDGTAVDASIPVTPDLYGDLDLAGTGVIEFGNRALPGFTQTYPMPGQTHITGIQLDDCYQLESICFNAQAFCEEISAVNCPALNYVQLINGAFRRIAFDMPENGKTVDAVAFGNGNIGAEYIDGELTLYAYPKGETFIGWFEGGELVSTELEYVRTEGGSLVAVFGGDADGDGAVTVADAVLTMRASMGIIQVANSGMLDVDGSEDIDIADALLIMRFAMGLIG